MRPTRCVVVLFAVLIACPLLAAYPNVERAPAGDKSPGSKYVIEPPEVLQIEMLKLVPLPPYRAESFDVLQLHVSGTLPDQPIDNYYIAEADGTINLGPAYGTVRVAGLALDEIKRTVEKKLREVLKAPVVSVQLARAFGAQPVTGQYLVAADGTVNLRRYGSVKVAGKTVTEARLAIEKHLAEYLDSPQVSVTKAPTSKATTPTERVSGSRATTDSTVRGSPSGRAYNQSRSGF